MRRRLLAVLIDYCVVLAWRSSCCRGSSVGVTVALALIRRDGAALHDLIAGTRVVRAE